MHSALIDNDTVRKKNNEAFISKSAFHQKFQIEYATTIIFPLSNTSTEGCGYHSSLDQYHHIKKPPIFMIIYQLLLYQ